MDASLSRRGFLTTCAVGATGALAGCADPDVAMFVEPVSTDSAIAERATLSPEQYGPYRSLVASAVDGGATRPSETQDDPPFQPDRPVVHDGVVYTLDWVATDQQETRTEHALSVTVHDDDRGTDASFGDLPEVDRDHLSTVRQAVERAVEDDRPLPEATVQHHYTSAERDQSALVPDPQYDAIEMGGRPATVSVREVTVTLSVFRYTAREHDPVAAFGAELRANHRFALAGLTDTERDFFESVQSEGSTYQAEDGFEGVADRLVAEPALFVDGREGEWIVEYEGDSHWVTVDFVRMPEYADRLEAVETL